METINLNVSLTLKQLIEVVKKLSPVDKSTLNEAIWEDDFVIAEKHKVLINNRIKKAKENPNRLLDWDIVSKNL